MQQWTTAQRYRPYSAYSKKLISQLQKQQQDSIWHLGYHIQPASGLLNDPNGFAYYNHQWHVFYQNFPFGPVHGLKSWVHLTSPDLTHWMADGLKLLPDTTYESHGAYSGSALAVGSELFLMYTGNVRDDNWQRHPYQLGATLDQNGTLHKLAQPLIGDIPAGYTDHFRDPQLIEHEGTYYAFIGVRKQDDTAHILAYQAPDPKGPWTLKGELHFSDQNLGYMIECPNLIFIDQRPVLIFCPQGLSQNIASYDNIYPNMYIVGEAFDWDTFSFINPTGPQNLDGGFDVYATQAFNAPDDQAYAISWLGLPDTTYPSDAENWQGCFSLVKHLTLVDRQLHQQPVAQGLAAENFAPKTADLHLQEKLQFDFATFPKGQLQIKAQHSGDKLTLSFDEQAHSLTVDRRQMGQAVALDHGTTRSIQLPATALHLTLWLDHSAFELYVNDGAQVISGRLFPRQADTYQLDTSQLAADGFEVSGTRLQTIY